uniref:Doublecortin domain containing 2C n=1 Tax=Chelonoidis abingdonii TaxID=106734 RepID=A0A8C0JB19_CHEAB
MPGGERGPARDSCGIRGTVLVYRNGDPFYSGRKFVIHHRHVRTFEALIAQLNEGVEVPFGVRTLYTPQEGHRIRNLSDLKQGGKYVAAGREKFKKLDKIRVPSRWQLISNKPRNINVFTNGDMLIPPIKFIIPRFTLKNWNCVLALINEKIFPRSGGVHRLYTLDGHAVRNSDGLEDNHYYVAVGKEKFKSLPYWRSSRVSPEVQRAVRHFATTCACQGSAPQLRWPWTTQAHPYRSMQAPVSLCRLATGTLQPLSISLEYPASDPLDVHSSHRFAAPKEPIHPSLSVPP